jgi:hypothetical protein
MTEQPFLIVLHGLPAVGKYTIGKDLLERLQSHGNYKFFHNHLVVDAVVSLFPFGSPNFKKFREEIWLSMIPEALREGSNIIYTFSPDVTVSEDYPIKLKEAVEKVGGRMVGIKITCPDQEIDHRMSARTEYEKLKDVEFYHQLKTNGAFDFPNFPVDFLLDSNQLSSKQSAEEIAGFILLEKEVN